MSCLKELSITEPLVTAINPESVVSDSVVVKVRVFAMENVLMRDHSSYRLLM